MRRFAGIMVALALLSVVATGCSAHEPQQNVTVKTVKHEESSEPKYVLTDKGNKGDNISRETNLSAHDEDELYKLLEDIEGETNE